MTETVTEVMSGIRETQGRIAELMDRVYSAAHVRAVYSEPVQSGSYTVITASEVMAGGGFGIGQGFGPTPPEPQTADADTSQPTGGGGGGGGGGGSMGRPVAVVLIGPQGVEVRPVVDVTKIALAALTAWAVMLPTLIRILKPRRG
jgi:uncharacterized spore protein YtfJ